MALPSSGPITLAQIQAEFGGSSPISLANYYKGGLYVKETDYAPNVPTSGPINLADFYSARKTTLVTRTYTVPGSLNTFVVPDTIVGNVNIVSVIGGGGGGGGNDSHPGYPGYPGMNILGGNISVVPGDVISVYVGGGGGAGTTSPDGGGGGKIICNRLAKLGYFDAAMNEADQRFGEKLRGEDSQAYHGYLRWAQPVVDLMDGGGSEKLRRWVLFWEKDPVRRVELQKRIVVFYLDALARPWAEEMAHIMHAPGYEKSNPAGRIIMRIGMPLNRFIGRLDSKEKMPPVLKIACIWATVTVLLAVVTPILLIDKIVKKLKGKKT
jgi:hypothetical protein